MFAGVSGVSGVSGVVGVSVYVGVDVDVISCSVIIVGVWLLGILNQLIAPILFKKSVELINLELENLPPSLSLTKYSKISCVEGIEQVCNIGSIAFNSSIAFFIAFVVPTILSGFCNLSSL